MTVNGNEFFKMLCWLVIFGVMFIKGWYIALIILVAIIIGLLSID